MSTVEDARRDVQRMKEEIAKLEALNEALEENTDRIEYSAQKAVLAAQTAMHTITNIPTSTSNPSPRGRGDATPSSPSSPASVGSTKMAPKPPPRKPAGISGVGVSLRRSAPKQLDQVQVDVMVEALVEGGIRTDMALAAVYATNADSLEAAREWISTRAGTTAGTGNIRAIRNLRCTPMDRRQLSDSSIGSGSSGPTTPASTTSASKTSQSQSYSPPRGTSSAANAVVGTHLPKATPTVPGQVPVAKSNAFVLSTRTTPGVGADGQNTALPTLSTPKKQTTPVPATSPSRTAPWTVPSPPRANQNGGSTSTSSALVSSSSVGEVTPPVPEVKIQVRCTGGKLVQLNRLFFPTDSMRSVLHELLRTYPEYAPTGSQSNSADSCSFAIPFPKAKYSYAEMGAVTLHQAGLCPRGTVILVKEGA